MSQKLIDRIIIAVAALAVLALAGGWALRRHAASEPSGEPEIASAAENPAAEPLICGLAVLTEDERLARSEGKTEIQHPAKLWDILRFNGQPIPYDQRTNTCYLTQPPESDTYEGAFQTVHADTTAYWMAEGPEAPPEKGAAITAGTRHQIWISAPDTCATVNVVFTTLPVVDIYTGSQLSTEYTNSEIFVWDTETGGGTDTTASYSVTKESSSGETITVKLTREGYAAHDRLPLLGMDEYYAWKLYAVRSDRTFHMAFAFDLWNLCDSDGRLSVPFRYVELVVDGEYKGLYILRPRADEDCFTALRRPVVTLDTDDLEPGGVPADLYLTYPPENLSDLGLYYEATYAYANLYDDTILLKDYDGAYFAVPGKPEYVFGDFPRRYNYLAYQFEERMITSADFGFNGEQAREFDDALRSRWAEARGGFLSGNSIQARLDAFAEALRASGWAARQELTALWQEDAPELGDRFAVQERDVLNAINTRFANVDERLR